MATDEHRGVRLGARELVAIQGGIDAAPWLTREEVARRLCRRCGWRQADGRWAVRSCRSLLGRLERAGRLRLPPPRRAGNYFARRRPAAGPADAGAPAPAGGPAGPLVVRPVASAAERAAWHAAMARHHSLGDGALVGESLCYTAWLGPHVVAHLGWAAAALRNTPRDRALGWDAAARRRGLPFVVGNVRFLLLPGGSPPHLASQVLARTCRRLAADWQATYGHPVLLAETFVDVGRFRGTCYRAANWRCVGHTRGFSRRGPTYAPNGAPKAVFLYPLVRRAGARLAALTRPGRAGPARAAGSAAGEEGTVGMGVDVERLPLEGEDGLFALLGTVPDGRQRRGKRHTLQAILAVAAVALLSGRRSLAAIAQFARELPEPARRRLGGRPLRPPSEPTFRRVLQGLDVAALDRTLGQWRLAQGAAGDAAVAVDGKTLRGRGDGAARPVHLLAALPHTSGVVIAQTPVPADTNEITRVAPLLEPLELTGTVVTGDALLTQRELAGYLVEQKGAEYLFTVKDNQRTLRQDIQHRGHGAFSPGAPARRDAR